MNHPLQKDQPEFLPTPPKKVPDFFGPFVHLPEIDCFKWLAIPYLFLAVLLCPTSVSAQEDPEEPPNLEDVEKLAIDGWATYAKRLEDFVLLPLEGSSKTAADPEAKRTALIQAELRLLELKDLLNSVSDSMNKDAGPRALKAVQILVTTESGDTLPALQYLEVNRNTIVAEAKELAEMKDQKPAAFEKILRPLLLKSALHQFRLEDKESLKELLFVESIAPEWVAVNRDLGDLMEETGNRPEALRYLKLTVSQDAPSGHKAYDYLALGRIYYEEEEYDEAVDAYRHALTHMRESGGLTDPQTLMTQEYLADALNLAGNTKEAEKMYRGTAYTRQLTQGMNHPEAMICKGRLARLLAENQRYEEAEEILLVVVETLDKVLGPENDTSISYASLLGHVYLRQHKYELAIPHYERVVRARKNVQPLTDDTFFAPASELALVYLALEQYDKAEPLVLELLNRASEGFGPESADAVFMRQQYGELLLDKGRPKEALEHLQFVYRVYVKENGQNDSSSLRCSSLIADCFQALNQFDEAEALFQKNISGYEEAFGPNHKNVEWARGKLKRCREARKTQ